MDAGTGWAGSIVSRLRHGRRIIGLAMGAALICASGLPVAAAPPRITVQPGLQGFCRQSEWFPVTVDISTSGEAARGQLMIRLPNAGGRTSTVYTKNISLGDRARQRHTLYVRNDNLPGVLPVKLLRPAGDVINTSAALSPISPEERLVVVVGQTRGGQLSYLSGQNSTRIAELFSDYLPDRPEGYAAADIVALGDISAADIRPEAKAALRRWVESGGTLVVMGGPNWARLKDPFYAKLLPVEVAGATPVAGMPALQGVFGDPLSETAVITQAQPHADATVTLAQDGKPLMVEGPVGAGKVIFLAFDAAEEPLRSWAGQPRLWSYLVFRARVTAPVSRLALADYAQAFAGSSPVTASILNIPAMSLPSFWWIAAFLAAYVIILVPVNYAVLKWRKRRELAWITTPAIVLVFCSLAYGIGYQTRGGRMLVNQLSVIETRAGSTVGSLTSFAGIFSPSRTSYDLSADRPGIALAEVPTDQQNARNLTIAQNGDMELPSLPIDMWSMRIFRLEGTADLGAGLQGSLQLDHGNLTGKVTNRTGMRLRDCTLYAGGGERAIGDLANGASTSVQLSVGDGQPAGITVSAGSMTYAGHRLASNRLPSPSSTGGSPADAMRAGVNAVLFDRSMGAYRGGGAMIAGWCDRPAAALKVRGHSPSATSLTLVLVHLPVTLAPGNDQSVPFRVMDSAISESQGVRTDWSGPVLSNGHLVADYALPGGATLAAVSDLRVSAQHVLTSHGSPPSGQPPVTLSVWNWRSGAWDRLRQSGGYGVGAAHGMPSWNAPLPDSPSHVLLPLGLVRLRMDNSSSADAQLRTFDVRLTGRAP